MGQLIVVQIQRGLAGCTKRYERDEEAGGRTARSLDAVARDEDAR